MRSLERVLKKIKDKNPFWSDYICFAEAIKKRSFSKETIRRYFNKLVDKNEYDKKDKKDILKHLLILTRKKSKAPEDDQI